MGADSPLRRVTRARVLVGALGAASLLGYGLGFPRLVSASPRTHVAYIGVFGGLFLLYVLAVAMVLRWRPDDRVLLGLVLAFALLFRLSLLGSPVVLSSDVYRYLWDGRVQWAGISPYRYPPTAAELVPLRDETIHPRINRPTKPTVYPPGAQAAFALVALVSPNNLPAWRVFLLSSEILTMGLLLVLLQRAGVTQAAVIVYAWSPLVVFEGVQAGHVDLAMIPLVLAALACRQRGSSVRAGIALGAAVLVKLYPLILLPAWWRPRDWRFPAAVAATVVRLTGDLARGGAMALLFSLMAGILAWIGRTNGGNAAGMTSAGALAVGTYLLLVPTSMHPWYVLWIVPFLCFRLWPAWLYFTGAVTLSYMSYVVEPAPIPWWAWLAEWGPLGALLLHSGWGALAHPVRASFVPRSM